MLRVAVRLTRPQLAHLLLQQLGLVAAAHAQGPDVPRLAAATFDEHACSSQSSSSMGSSAYAASTQSLSTNGSSPGCAHAVVGVNEAAFQEAAFQLLAPPGQPTLTPLLGPAPSALKPASIPTGNSTGGAKVATAQAPPQLLQHLVSWLCEGRVPDAICLALRAVILARAGSWHAAATHAGRAVTMLEQGLASQSSESITPEESEALLDQLAGAHSVLGQSLMVLATTAAGAIDNGNSCSASGKAPQGMKHLLPPGSNTAMEPNDLSLTCLPGTTDSTALAVLPAADTPMDASTHARALFALAVASELSPQDASHAAALCSPTALVMGGDALLAARRKARAHVATLLGGQTSTAAAAAAAASQATSGDTADASQGSPTSASKSTEQLKQQQRPEQQPEQGGGTGSAVHARIPSHAAECAHLIRPSRTHTGCGGSFGAARVQDQAVHCCEGGCVDRAGGRGPVCGRLAVG